MPVSIRAVASRSLPLALILRALQTAGCRRGEEAAAPTPAAILAGTASTPPSPAQQALLDQLPPDYRHADLDNGRLHLSLCKPCHTFTEGGPNMTGPNLYGVFGRRVASAEGYDYSPALRARDWTWDAAHLNGWLRSPRTYVPDTRMSFYGIPDDQDRRDLIAYLKVVTGGGPP